MSSQFVWVISGMDEVGLIVPAVFHHRKDALEAFAKCSEKRWVVTLKKCRIRGDPNTRRTENDPPWLP